MKILRWITLTIPIMMLYLLSPAMVFAQQSSGTGGNSGGIDLYTAILAYGVAAPFAGICIWQLVKAEKRADKAEVKQEKKDDELLRLVKELSPLVSEATQTLEKVQSGMAEQVKAVQGTVERGEWDLVVRRLEVAAGELVNEVRETRNERFDRGKDR